MSSDLKVTNIKHESSASNNLVLGSDGNVSITNTLSAGTLGSSVVGGNMAVGTVSESSGTPTGDIIEVGTYTSPNRRWVRFADGTQIVVLEPFDSSFTAATSFTYTFNFGKNFKSGTKPAVSVSGTPRLSAAIYGGTTWTTYGHSDSVVYLRAILYGQNVSDVRELSAIAVGRWF
jgi:hypothetical protein